MIYNTMTNAHDVSRRYNIFHQAGTGQNPWEIGRAQPVIVKLVEDGAFQGEVLDIGCGIGDNAIYIASHGDNIHLTAIDFAPRALQIARDKAESHNLNIQFELFNLLEDPSWTNLRRHSYDTILDSGIFHIFSNEDRLQYLSNLEYLIKPGGLYIQLCFSEKETRPGGPRRIKKSDLYALFSPRNGWRIESIQDVIYKTTPNWPFFGDVRAYLSFIRRL